MSSISTSRWSATNSISSDGSWTVTTARLVKAAAETVDQRPASKTTRIAISPAKEKKHHKITLAGARQRGKGTPAGTLPNYKAPSAALLRSGTLQKPRPLSEPHWLRKTVGSLNLRSPCTAADNAGRRPDNVHAQPSIRGQTINGASDADGPAGLQHRIQYSIRPARVLERPRRPPPGRAGGGGGPSFKKLRAARGDKGGPRYQHSFCSSGAPSCDHRQTYIRAGYDQNAAVESEAVLKGIQNDNSIATAKGPDEASFHRRLSGHPGGSAFRRAVNVKNGDLKRDGPRPSKLTGHSGKGQPSNYSGNRCRKPGSKWHWGFTFKLWRRNFSSVVH